MSRSHLVALSCVALLSSPAFAAAPTQAEQRSMTLAFDLCAALVGTDPAGIDAAAATIPGLVLTPPLPLESFPAKYRDVVGKLLNLSATDNLRLANFGERPASEGYFAAIRPDARSCFTIAAGAPAAARLFEEKLNQPNSGWKATDEKGLWLGESRNRTPLAFVVRSAEGSVVAAVLAKGSMLDASTTNTADQRALALTEFCGRSLLEGADAMPAIVKGFPGMTLSDPQPLSTTGLAKPERTAKALRISADTPVRIAGFGEASSHAAIRTDAEICDITVMGTANTDSLFAERFGRADSGWTPVKVKAAFQHAWKRPGRDGAQVSVLLHSQADVTLILVFTFKPGSQVSAEASTIATVFVEKCVAAIRAWQPANPADFAPAFRLDSKPKGKMTMLTAAGNNTGLVLGLRFDKKTGPDCVATAMQSSIPVNRIFDAMVEAFLLQPGSVASESPKKSWRVPVAEGRTAVMSGSAEGTMLVVTIHPEVAK